MLIVNRAYYIPDVKRGRKYRLWSRLVYDGDYLGHGGGSIGGITSFLMYPEDNLVLVMLSNSSVTNYGNVDHRIARLFVKAKKAAQD